MATNIFLDKILYEAVENMPTPALLIDENHQIQYSNKAYKNFFDANNIDVIGNKYGHVQGCVYFKDESLECGETTFCSKCLIRRRVNDALERRKTTDNEKLVREFYIDNKRELKYYEFSTQLISADKKYVFVLINDLTKFGKQAFDMEKKYHELHKEYKDEF
jgi:PAS domain-containing protein